jgi:hypothetical protein
MWTVTLPSGKTYTYGRNGESRARDLARRTGGTVTYTGPRWSGDSDDGHDRARDAALVAGYRRRY